MNCIKVRDIIVSWLKDKAIKANKKGFVVGVSGGIDSALVSTLCALTKMPTYLLQLPINRKIGEISNRAEQHCQSLELHFSNVFAYKEDLSETYNTMMDVNIEYNFNRNPIMKISPLAEANLASRLRMCSLYTYANTFNSFVVGTGNKIEDFGVGFFTKYGDGGVDISPIGDLLKSEIRELSVFLCIHPDIINATPTDELWDDNRSDEQQIGASYDELEKALGVYNEWKIHNAYSSSDISIDDYISSCDNGFKKVMKIFIQRHDANAHKMQMPPVCFFDNKN